MDELDPVDIAGSAIASISVVTTLIGALRSKGLLSSSEVDAVYENALSSLERLPNLDEPSVRRARQIVEQLAHLSLGTAKAQQPKPKG